MTNPDLTRDLIVDKFFYDLTLQEHPQHVDNMIIEAHEKACYAYDMVNTILEIK